MPLKKNKSVRNSVSYGLVLLRMWLYCVFFVTYSPMTVYIHRKEKYNEVFYHPMIHYRIYDFTAQELGVCSILE